MGAAYELLSVGTAEVELAPGSVDDRQNGQPRAEVGEDPEPPVDLVTPAGPRIRK